ncbi:Hsp20/alpha crystallin family protein [Candidatus Micrarchaeota archaeon]|nr:Hsp20/alpha crystallin family protein [Candidatus Micrarchaeota archaeon]
MPFWEKKKKKPEDPFDDFFGEDFSKVMSKMMEDMQKSFAGMQGFNEEAFKNLKPGKPMVYGFSMNIGPNGKAKFEEFGNVEPGKKPAIKDEREPLVDIIEKDAHITVIAELPGVEKKDIKISLEDENSAVVINVPNKFHKKTALPMKVKPDVSKATYKNGVLEIELEKAKRGKSTQIKVE